MAKKPEQESFVDMFTRLGNELRLPSVEVDKIVAHHRKNLEALEKSGRAATAGAGELAAKQKAIFEKTLSDIHDMAERYAKPASPQEMMARQLEFGRKSFETAMENTTQMADLMRRSGEESLGILRERIREGMQEIREAYDKRS
jgi:phasin family protein